MRTITLFIAPLLTAACAEEALQPDPHDAETELRAGMGQAGGSTAGLSADAEDDLAFMREEEKLARDVYLTLHEAWGVPAHRNIARSEQKHTDALEGLLDRYDLPDPVVTDDVGAFTNPDLGVLYDELVDLGTSSVVDSLVVGATIEDLDIIDIAHAMERTDDPTILATYGSLMCGSRNHLRSFVDLLADEGVDYEAQFMTPAQLDEIVSTPYETCG